MFEVVACNYSFPLLSVCCLSETYCGAVGSSATGSCVCPNALQETPFAAGVTGDGDGRRASADGEGDADGGAAGGGAEGGGGGSAALDLVLSKLGTCVSRDLADELAVNFCYCNTKGNRK